MAKEAAKKEALSAHDVLTGLFSKKDAAAYVANGCRHLHSSVLGSRDTCVTLTREAIQHGSVPVFPWEKVKEAELFTLSSSADRFSIIREVASKCAGLKREPREKLESVLEEMVTNAFYHAYRRTDGHPKYPRHKPVKLDASERIDVRFHRSEAGIYLAVTDRGGSFLFHEVASAFQRCYGAAGQQILQKESGAGLGIYMIFETVTHLKICTRQGTRTEMSCWLADKRAFDPDYFSFNFFEGR